MSMLWYRVLRWSSQSAYRLRDRCTDAFESKLHFCATFGTLIPDQWGRSFKWWILVETRRVILYSFSAKMQIIPALEINSSPVLCGWWTSLVRCLPCARCTHWRRSALASLLCTEDERMVSRCLRTVEPLFKTKRVKLTNGAWIKKLPLQGMLKCWSAKFPTKR